MLIINSLQAQDNYKIFLVGDAGDYKEAGETLINLKKELNNNPNSTVLFLGDNSYKDILWGIVPFGYKGFDSSKNTIEKLSSQIALLDAYHGSVYFVPGNHDWWNRPSYEKGKPKLAMEQAFIEENLKRNSTIANREKFFLPANGSYGPDFVELDSQRIRLVFIDTYRIIQTGIKKKAVPEEEKTFYNKLDTIIRQGFEKNEKVMVVAHHPVYSVGPYNRPLKHPYLFRRIKASMVNFPSYKAMADNINTVLQRYPGIYYVSGHLHALQYFNTPDSVHYIVSGAGSNDKILHVKNIHQYDAHGATNEYILWNTGGFFEVEFNGLTIHTNLFYDNGASKRNIQ